MLSYISNKVPEITIFFWVIKIMATTVGETGADFLNMHLGIWLSDTSWIMAWLLLITLIFQFRTQKYTPVTYWTVVLFISVAGTLLTDTLTDTLGVNLEVSTLVFSVLLALVFSFWYRQEKTLSIHSINTPKRELYYWIAILFTFALGTASWDLLAEGFDLGYSTSALIFAWAIWVVSLLYYYKKLDWVVAFWLAYILTRPFGASCGDYLSQWRENGGLGLWTINTSILFTVTIIALVIYLSVKENHPQWV